MKKVERNEEFQVPGSKFQVPSDALNQVFWKLNSKQQ